ncbi:MAG: response regulator [Chloroflexi bacterium]|jgi:CheY-like chemotaxis protein|nr:MAG: putative two-component response regulator receiver protein [Chloroflexi bacterium OLB13]MBC6956392.1 response regulator [Chloroflexota bacterium]MBV6436391.1 Regulator of RpoS [Anaerolineae bacterium]MDL1916553.1 response regulator [Anaerolineae bacterium CFX4]MBW7879914.1 response regulator [Anaerolineae bacterium]
MATKGRILIVDDDTDIQFMLKFYFTGVGYEVETADHGRDAIALARRQPHSLIILDIMLPDMDGFEVCRELRTNNRTKYIPIIFLTQRDERSDRLNGLELGADDYVTKPFDVDELGLRVGNAIQSANQIGEIDPRSKLPTGRLIEDYLRGLMRQARPWTYIDGKINNFDTFADVYSFVAADELIRFTAMLLAEIIEQFGTPDDFIGHPGRDNFVVVTHAADAKRLQEEIENRFASGVKQHYSFIDRERGYVLVPDSSGDRRVELMSMAIGTVSTTTHRFSDIREITELAAEDRRRRAAGIIENESTRFRSTW